MDELGNEAATAFKPLPALPATGWRNVTGDDSDEPILDNEGQRSDQQPGATVPASSSMPAPPAPVAGVTDHVASMQHTASNADAYSPETQQQLMDVQVSPCQIWPL